MNFEMTFETIFLGADMFGTRAMLLLFALFAIKAFGLAITLFLSVLESQLIAMSIRSSVSLVLTVRIWFWKRRRKPSDKSNQIQPSNIRPHRAHPNIDWSLLSFKHDCKRGRQAANNHHNPAAAAMLSTASGNDIFQNILSELLSNVDRCLAHTANLFDAHVLSLHTGSAFSEINNKNLAVVTTISSNRPVFVVENILQITGKALALVAVLSTAAINSAAQIIQSVVLGGETIFYLTIALKDIFFRGRAPGLSISMQICHHLRPAAMASAVLPNTIYLLPKESVSSLTFEGATQDVGNFRSVTAIFAGIYTHSLVQLPPMIQHQLFESVSFRGRAFRFQLPAKILDLFFNLRAWCPVAVAPPFARECEYIWGLPNSQHSGYAAARYPAEYEFLRGDAIRYYAVVRGRF